MQKGWVTPQQGDTDRLNLQARDAALNVAQANIVAQKAQLRVLHQQKAYQTVVAPFDGVITQCNVDIGVDVQADATSGTFMFEIMQKDVIRVWVYVPQDAAFGVAPGVAAVVQVPELPDRKFPGTVTRIAEAQQSGTRALLTEIDLPNPDGVLRSGVYPRAGRRLSSCLPRPSSSTATANRWRAEIASCCNQPRRSLRLLAESQSAVVNEPLLLGVSVAPALDDGSLLVNGLAQGTRLSSGVPR